MSVRYFALANLLYRPDVWDCLAEEHRRAARERRDRKGKPPERDRKAAASGEKGLFA